MSGRLFITATLLATLQNTDKQGPEVKWHVSAGLSKYQSRTNGRFMLISILKETDK